MDTILRDAVILSILYQRVRGCPVTSPTFKLCCSAVQMYPHSSQDQTDILAANEVATHVTLQQRQDSPYLYHLLGGFEVQDPDASPGREQVKAMSVDVRQLSQSITTCCMLHDYS